MTKTEKQARVGALAHMVEEIATTFFVVPDSTEEEPKPERKTAQWKHIGDGTERFYCSACNERTNVITRDGDLVDIAPFMNGWRFCPSCGAEMISEAGTT